MKKIYWIIIGISVPLALFGIVLLSSYYTLTLIDDISVTWMIELESNLNLSDGELMQQMKNEDTEELIILRIQHLSNYFDTLPLDAYQLKQELPSTENRYIFYVYEDSGYSKDEIRKILTDIDGIRDANRITFSLSPTP
jgi:hypothetical protein